ncbi:MAG: cation:proton antiporter [Anaerolineae bacterium]|nr:cation:proton antiporter [Anaerolineae bacterium]
MSLEQIALYIFLPLLVVAIIFTVLRFIRGPRISDRIVSLDSLVTLGIGIIVTYAIATDEPVILDTATVLALISFLGTVAFAYYLQRRG